jgi:hypothetical protein
VLWGWIDEDLSSEELAGINQLQEALTGSLGDELAGLLTAAEVAALSQRCDRLCAEARFPGPQGDMPAVPWPLF